VCVRICDWVAAPLVWHVICLGGFALESVLFLLFCFVSGVS
jgi:hypothetical protein